MADKKILIVDDEEELLGLVEKLFSSEGYKVAAVTSACDAIDKARVFMPDLILIDIMLPDMEGPEAIRILNRDPLTKDIPAIFLSGIVTREQGETVSDIRVGERLYRALGKPVPPQELMAEVRNVIG